MPQTAQTLTIAHGSSAGYGGHSTVHVTNPRAGVPGYYGPDSVALPFPLPLTPPNSPSNKIIHQSEDGNVFIAWAKGGAVRLGDMKKGITIPSTRNPKAVSFARMAERQASSWTDKDFTVAVDGLINYLDSGVEIAASLDSDLTVIRAVPGGASLSVRTSGDGYVITHPNSPEPWVSDTKSDYLVEQFVNVVEFMGEDWSDTDFEKGLLKVLKYVGNADYYGYEPTLLRGERNIRNGANVGKPFIKLKIAEPITGRHFSRRDRFYIYMGFLNNASVTTDCPEAFKFAKLVASSNYDNVSEEDFSNDVARVLHLVVEYDKRNAPSNRILAYLDSKTCDSLPAATTNSTSVDPSRALAYVEPPYNPDQPTKFTWDVKDNKPVTFKPWQKTIRENIYSKPVTVNLFDMHVGNDHVGRIGFLHNKLTDLKIFPQFRGKGYARHLMSWAVAQKKPPLHIIASPQEESIPLAKLIDFYKSFGFTPLRSDNTYRCPMVRLL